MIFFNYEGKIQPKQRPKATRKGRFITVYTPIETVKSEEDIVRQFRQQFKNHVAWAKDSPVTMAIELYVAVPKSFSKKKRSLALANEMLPTGKPDVDNTAKTILDALNKHLYEDDGQVCELKVVKSYGNKDGAFITAAITNWIK